MPADLAIRRLSARTPASAQPVAARLALQALGADLADALPRGLPPQSLLWLRRLQLQAPEALLSRPVPAAWRQGWIAAGRERLDAAWAHAARPALGLVADSAPAVLFADAAEMLACLVLAAQAGALDRWWWRGLLGRSWPHWQAAWASRPEAQPGAVRLLSRTAQGGDARAQAALRAIVNSGFAALPVPGHAGAVFRHAPTAATGDVAVASQERGGCAPAGPRGPHAPAVTPSPIVVPMSPASRVPQRAAGAPLQQANAAPVVPLQPLADGAKAAQPAALRRPMHAKHLSPEPLAAHGEHLLPTGESPAAEPVAQPAFAALAGERHASVAAACPTPRHLAAAAPTAPDASAPAPTLPAAGPAAQLQGVIPRVASPAAAPLTPSPAPTPPGPLRPVPPALPTPAPTTTAHAGTTTLAWPWPQVLPTRQAPLLFLVNALLEDGLYPDFTRPRDPGLPVPLWALLPALARVWRLPRDDALHAAMAERCPGWTAPGAMPAAPGAAAGPWPAWLAGYARTLRRRLCRRLGLRPSAWPQALVLARPARLWLSESEWVAEFDLPAHDVAWRLAGLDRDPGWLPSAGCSMRFRFIC